MPLTAPMEEFCRDNKDIVCVTMDGLIKNGDGANVSLEEAVSGKYKLIYGHGESFNTPTGREIAKRVEGRLIFIGKDEAHVSFLDQWGGSFRSELYSVPAELKAQANKNIPCFIASATLTLEDEEKVKKMMKIRKNLVIIRQNPILDNIRIVNIQRPKKSIDFKGDWYPNGTLKQPGTQQLLDRIVLDYFDEAMVNKDFSKFKTTIIFTNTKLGPELNNYLGLKYPGIPQEQRPWMWNHSERDKATVQDMFTRVQPGHPHQIRIIITTTCIMGVNKIEEKKIL